MPAWRFCRPVGRRFAEGSILNRKKWTISEKVLFLTPLLFALVGATAFLPDGSRMFPAILESMGMMTRESGNLSSCQSNLKMVSLGLMMYKHDYDDKFPLVATCGSGYGWADLVQPYLSSSWIFQCPKIGKIGPRTSNRFTDYFYNARLSAIEERKVGQPALTVLFGEGISSDARYAKTQLPPRWIGDLKSPAHRHFQPKSTTGSGANYAFADGHVKWVQPQHIGTASAFGGKYTFSTQ